MDPKTVRRLRSLLERKRRADKTSAETAEEFALAIYVACEEQGASRREVGRALGIGKTTVQDWVDRGRQRRSS